MLLLQAFTDKKGDPKTDEATLKAIDDPVIHLLMDYRQMVKNQQFLVQWSHWMGDDGRLHPSFNLVGTVTGRRSCSNPNLQQVPRDTLMRSILGAPPGWLMLEVDYSQAEVRLAASIAGAESLLRLYRQGLDVYKYLAARINNTTYEDVTPDNRQKAKVAVLGFLYGLSAGGFVGYAWDLYGMRITREEAEVLRDGFFSEFPEFVRWH